MTIKADKVVGSLLLFNRLDVSRNLNGVYALTYRFEDKTDETWTSRLTPLKWGKASAVRGACAVLPRAVANISLPASPVVLVSAIPSNAMALPTSHPLYRLGSAVAAQTAWRWEPSALTKKTHRSLTGLTGMEARDKEVADAYSATTVGKAACCIILDDFVTRGATLNDAARAMRRANPELRFVYGLVLGKNEKISFAETRGITLDNSHVSPTLQAAWDNA